MTSSPNSQDYQVIETVTSDGDIPITLYQNKITGLKVVSAYVECPIVKGDLVLATEAFDDDGLPHTLEHLIFMGSESYPYKGVLDKLANKCLASGTNAYTDTDHTNYTLSTAGSDGFLSLLPIYLDHLLFPTLKDSFYVTEVHHINGDGEDAGIVYCEMQASENDGDSRCHLEMLRDLYPGKCGYKSETGGLMKNLRESTNNIKVKNYHKKFYQAKNLCVIVTGPVLPESIFKAIKSVEDKIVLKGLDKIEIERPWQTPVEPLEASKTRKIQFSSDTDDDGLVYIGFRGPNVVTDYKDFVAVASLLDYLNTTAISPVQRDFVECEEPYCSSVSHFSIENSTSCFYLTFESVGKQYLDLVADKFFDLLKNIYEGREKLDMQRLRTIISRKIVRILSASEISPHSVVVGPVIGHFLYGTSSIKDRCQEIPLLNEFMAHDSKFWLDLIEKYMVGSSSRYSCIVGEPSPQMMQSTADQEKNRLKNQKEELKDKLTVMAADLKRSIQENEIPAPEALLKSVTIPSPDSIKFHSIERAVVDKNKVPFRLQYDSIKTNFVSIHVLLNTSKLLNKTDRLHLPLLSEVILESPIERDGSLVPYEKIVEELFSDTITYQSSIGISSSSVYSVGAMSMLFDIAFQVEISKYEKAVQWYNELLYKTVFTAERIKTIATRMASDITQYKRSGSKVASATINAITYQSNSNRWATNFVRQQKFLRQLLKDLKDNPDSVVKRMTKIRNCMTAPGNILVHLTLNKEKVDVSRLHEPWLKLIPEEVLSMNPSSQPIDLVNDIIPCHKLFEPVSDAKSVIVGLGSVESNFMNQFVKSIDCPKHPDVAALIVLIQYLTQLEGPMWCRLRGQGLSYHYYIRLSTYEGIMSFGLSNSTHCVAAYEKAIEIVNLLIDGHEGFDQDLYEASKSSLIFELIESEKNAASKSYQSLLAYLRDLDIDYNRSLIKKVALVTIEDLRRVGPLYLKPLFESPDRLTSVCCNSSKLDEVTEGFKTVGCHLKRVSLDHESFLTSIE